MLSKSVISSEHPEVIERVMEKLGAGECDPIVEGNKTKISIYTVAGKAHKALKEISKEYPAATIKGEIDIHYDMYIRTFIVTYKGGGETLEDIRLEYVWINLPDTYGFNNTSTDDIREDFETLFRRIDRVVIVENESGKYEIDDNINNEITITIPVDKQLKARATKRGQEIEFEGIFRKRTIVTWEKELEGTTTAPDLPF